MLTVKFQLLCLTYLAVEQSKISKYKYICILSYWGSFNTPGPATLPHSPFSISKLTHTAPVPTCRIVSSFCIHLCSEVNNLHAVVLHTQSTRLAICYECYILVSNMNIFQGIAPYFKFQYCDNSSLQYLIQIAYHQPLLGKIGCNQIHLKDKSTNFTQTSLFKKRF